MSERDCTHGQLARQCPICERDERIAELEARTKCRRDLPWCDCAALERERDEARAQLERLRNRITIVVDEVEAEPLPVGEPKESIMLGRLQVVDEIRAALAKEE